VPEDQPRLAREVERRIKLLPFSMRQLITRSKVAESTWKKLLRGEMPRDDAVRRMESALGGPAGVLALITSGQPFEWGPIPAGDVNSRLDRLEDQMADVRREIVDLREELSEALQQLRRPGPEET
jgi:hypothetical protein